MWGLGHETIPAVGKVALHQLGQPRTSGVRAANDIAIRSNPADERRLAIKINIAQQIDRTTEICG